MALAILPGWCTCCGSCLPPKLAKRVKAAGSVYGRLVAYATVADKQSRTLGRCLPSYRPWDDWPCCSAPPGFCDFQTPLDIVECVWTEMQSELAKWHPTGSAGRARLASLRSEVAKAYESYQRAVESHPAFLESRINRIRWMIEDVKADLGRMAQDQSPGAAP